MPIDTTETEAIRIHSYGGPEEMRHERIPVPAPAVGEVQILQHAVGINYLDTYHRRGVFPLPALPGVLGVEGSGEVVALGDGVTGLRPGQRVTYFGRPIGSYAGLRNIPAAAVLPLPDAISHEAAAAVTLQGITAHMLLRRVAPVGAGRSVLVHAAAGGLGAILCQWAKRDGARVIGTVGSERKAEVARAAGCDEVILYRQEPFAEAVSRLTDGAGVDVVFEGLGGQVFHDSLRCLKPFGHLVNLGQVAEGLPSVALADLGPARSLTVSVPGVFAYGADRSRLEAAGAELFDLIASGALEVRIGAHFPLAEAAEAHRALESRGTTGALVLIPEAAG